MKIIRLFKMKKKSTKPNFVKLYNNFTNIKIETRER